MWQVAHNRYARYFANKRRETEIRSEGLVIDHISEYDVDDEENLKREFEIVFHLLHTLSSEYKNILVDYYIGEMSVKELAKKYKLPETTIKWRLNVSRLKIRNRGEFGMDKVYKRINWAISACNGSLNPREYLSTQVARAICEAAYEKPLTIEEISLKTGLPIMYIEDALPNLIYGDAIEQINNKYTACFIILRFIDKEKMEKKFKPLIGLIADYFAAIYSEHAASIEEMSFYGYNFGIKRLGYIALPLALRRKILSIKASLPELASGPYPPRKDCGFGWFIVEESIDESDTGSEYVSGCNITSGERDFIYWFNVRQ